MTNIDPAAPAPKRRGRPPVQRVATRASDDAASTLERGAAGSLIGHNSAGRAVAMGRDGMELTRKRTQNSDIYYIPQEIIPEGFDYQWNPVEVLGKPFSAMEAGASLAMAENGWRPVPSDRHPGRFMPEGYEGPVIRDGLRLDERPMVLTLEARAEEAAKARTLVSDQIAQHRLASNMPSGFSRDNQELGRFERSKTTRTVAPAPDIPRPQLPIDPN